MKKAFMPWFENLNKMYQLVVLLIGASGMIVSGLVATYAVLVFVIDSRVQPQLRPIKEMLEFVLTDSGRWDAFIEEKERRARERKAFESPELTVKSPTDILRRAN